MKTIGYDMLYLCQCSFLGVAPKMERCQNIDLEKLFHMCKFHSLTAMVGDALESVGIKDHRFIEAKAKSIRKNILLQAEQQKICDFLEKAGIKNMPLKGAILKNLYPKAGMRQMADNDILYDGNYQKEIVQYMTENGYSATSVGVGNHDVFMKPPIYNFEMHRTLFGAGYEKRFVDYYKNIWDKLVKVENMQR